MIRRINKFFRQPNIKGILLAFGGTFLLGTNYITAKIGMRGFNPESFTLVWTGTAAVYSFLLMLVQREPKQLRVPSSSLKHLLLLGLFTGLGQIFNFTGLYLLSPTFQAFLHRSTPLITMILGIVILGESIKRGEIFPILIMIVGGCISTIGRWEIVGAGVIFTLLAALMVSGQFLIAKERSKNLNPLTLVFYRALLGTMVIAIWAFGSGRADFSQAEFQHWGITFFGAFLGPTLSFILNFKSYKYLDLVRQSEVLAIQPLLVFILAFSILGDMPTLKEFMGGFLILGGSAWLVSVHYRHRKQKQKVAKPPIIGK
jgi:drug/metabolite transporter (DMT)-like permease